MFSLSLFVPSQPSLPALPPSVAVLVLGFHVGGGSEGGWWGARNPSLACGVSPLQARLFFLFRAAFRVAGPLGKGGAGATRVWTERRVAEGEALGKR